MCSTGHALRIDGTNADHLAGLHPWFDAVSGRLPQAIQYGMRVALEEVVLNAAMHGFEPNQPGEIMVRLQVSSDIATLCVEDSGRAFDPSKAPSHLQPATLLEARPGGLGLVLLHHYCRDITYQRLLERNLLIMRFPLPAA